MIRRRFGLPFVAAAVLIAFGSGTAIGAVATRSEPDRTLRTCQRLLQQERADACTLLGHIGTGGFP